MVFNLIQRFFVIVQLRYTSIKGRKAGREEEKFAIAKNLLSQNIDMCAGHGVGAES